MSAGYLTTYTGIRFLVDEPTIDMINIDDIAHALAMICHFAGHTAQFFSVAQHSVLVSKACPPELAAWGLMHDAAEAYVGDVTRPLKVLLPGYKEIERRILCLIAEKFNLPWPEPPELKPIDDSILKLESRMLMRDAALHDGHGNHYAIADPPPIPPFYIAPMTIIQARIVFMQEFRQLFSTESSP